MPVYIDAHAYESLRATGEGALYPLVGDLSGNSYIRQTHFPSGQFTFSNLPHKYAASSVTGTVQTSGTVYAFPIYLPGGFVVQSIQYVLGTTTASALTHRWACLFNSAKACVASTADDTTAVPTVSTIISQNIATAGGVAATAYKVPSTLSTTAAEGMPVQYWVGLMMAGTTIGTLANVQAPLASVTATPAAGSTDLTSKTVVLATDASVSFTTITPLITVPWIGVS